MTMKCQWNDNEMRLTLNYKSNWFEDVFVYLYNNSIIKNSCKRIDMISTSKWNIWLSMHDVDVDWMRKRQK